MWDGRLWELAPGESSPYHWHAAEEEVLVVVAGSVVLRTPGGERELGLWDAAWFVRGDGGAHQVRNDGDEPARVLFVATHADPDVRFYPDDGVAVVIAGDRRLEVPLP